jgi:hypothetical protein
MTEKVSVGGRVKKVNTYVPLHQTRVLGGHKSYHTTSFKGVPTNLFNGTGQRYVGQIQMGSIGLIKSATLKVNVSVGGSATDKLAFTDLPHWFDRIEIKAQNGSKHITTLHNDTMLYNFNLIDQSRLQQLLVNANMKGDNSTSSAQWDPDDTEVTGTQKRTFYLPLIGSIFGHSPLYFGNSTGDLNIELHSSSGFVTPFTTTANNPTLSCDGIDLIIESESLALSDQIFHQNHHSSALTCQRFLEPVENHFYGQTINKNIEYKFDLDAVTGDVSHLLIGLQWSDPTNTLFYGAKTLAKMWAVMGIDKFDVLDATGKSIYGNGQAVDFTVYRSDIHPSNFATNFNNAIGRGWLVIPFCQDLKSAYHGVKDGFMRFDQNRKYVSLTTTSGHSNGTYDVKIYAFVHRKLSSSGGKFIASDDLDSP